MKRLIFSGLFLLLILAPLTQARALVDPLTVAPDMYKLLYENDRVRVMEVSFNPGQKVGSHSHPDHFITALDAGTLKISKPDGTSSNVELKAEQVIWIPAETHWAENTGKTKVRLLVTELKTGNTAPHH